MTKRQQQKRRSAVIIEALEPRILFSADVFGGAFDSFTSDDQDNEPLNLAAKMLDRYPSKDPLGTDELMRKELVLIDSLTPDYQTLLDALLARNNETLQIDTVLLDTDRDSLRQISEVLSNYSDLDAVHLISHGSDGAIVLGNKHLNLESVAANTETINAWGQAFAENGDFLIYGCNLAATADGQALTQALGRITGTDIAASEDLTGYAGQGGDWDLEYVHGNIETHTLMDRNNTFEWKFLLAAPTDIIFDDGLQTNESGVNDYAAVSNFNSSGGPGTQISIEISFAATVIPAGEVDFISYAVPGSDNEISVWMEPAGDIRATIGPPGSVTFNGYNAAPLFDGSQHQLSVSWDSATGETKLYVDGQLVVTETYNIGSDVSWGGTLVFGQEQDSVGGGFQSDQIFVGDIFEARFYEDVRSPQEIAENANKPLVNPIADANLAAYWQMTNNGAGGIDDLVRNNDLTLYNNASFNRDISVREDADYGDHVAFITSVADIDASDTHTFSLIDNAAGAFSINSITGEISVANASLLDYETANALNITVRATDSGGETYDEIVTVNIMNVNPESLAGNDTYTTDEDSLLNILAPGLLGNDSAGSGASDIAGNTVAVFNARSYNNGDSLWDAELGATALAIAPSIAHTNSPTNAPAGIDTAFVLNGNGGFTVNSLAEVVSSDAITIEMWFLLDDANTNQILLDFGENGEPNDFAFYIDAGEYVLAASNSLYSFPISPQSNTWTHLAVTIEANSGSQFDDVYIYLDGQVWNAGTPGRLNDSWSNNGIGVGAINGSADTNTENPGGLEGQISKFHIHDRLLTGAEINNNAANPAASVFIPFIAGYDDTSALGNVSVNPNGSFNFDPNGQFDWLKNGELANDIFTYTYDNGIGKTDTATVVVEINGVNDAPGIAVNTGTAVAEGQTATLITSAMLNGNDADDSAAELSYTLTATPTNGLLRLNGTPLNSNDAFTQADINAGLVTYDHDGSNTSADSFGFSLADGGEDGAVPATGVFNISVSAIDDDAPTQLINSGSMLSEGATASISNSALAFSDEQPASAIRFSVTASPANGQLELIGNPSVAITSFTQNDIDNNRVVYVHNGSNTLSDSFTFTVDDSQGNSLSGQSFNISVSAVDDDSPVVVNQSMAVAEGITNIALTLNELSSTDTDSGDTSLIYTLNDVSNGTLSINGSAWAAGSNDSFTQQDIINGTIRYSHDGSETASDSFSYSVRDPAGNALSGQSFSISVSAVNDAPGIAVNAGLSVAEGQTATLITSAMLNGNDADDSAAELSYTLTATPTNGLLRLNGTPLNSNDAFTQADINAGLVTYDHDGSNTSADSFGFSLADGGEDGAVPATGVFNISVSAIDDDAPTQLINSGSMLSEGATASISNSALAFSDEQPASAIRFSVTASPANGQLELIGNPSVAITSFTQNDIDNNRVVYVHNGSNTLSDSFTFTVDDSQGNSLSGQTFNISVSAVDDDAPTPPDSSSDSPTPEVTNVLDDNEPAVNNEPLGPIFNPNIDLSYGVINALLDTEGFDLSSLSPSFEPTLDILNKYAAQAPTTNENSSEKPAALEGRLTLRSNADEITVERESGQSFTMLFDAAVRIPSQNHLVLASVTADAHQHSAIVSSKFIDLRHLDFAPFEKHGAGSASVTSVMDNDAFLKGLNNMNRDLDEAEKERKAKLRLGAEVALGVTITLLTGFLDWLFRGGSLLASFLSVAPLWKQFDPLPILSSGPKKNEPAHDADEPEEGGEDTGLEDIFNGGDFAGQGKR